MKFLDFQVIVDGCLVELTKVIHRVDPKLVKRVQIFHQTRVHALEVLSQRRARLGQRPAAGRRGGGCCCGCGDGVYPIYTPDAPEGYCYDADCPCFEKSTDRYGRNSNLTVAQCSCFNVCDETSNTDCGSVSCDAMLASGEFHCSTDFCPTCDKKHWCDKSCGFGACEDPVVADIAERRLKRLFA